MSFNQLGACPSAARERIIRPSPNIAASMVDKIAVIMTMFISVLAQPIPQRVNASTSGLSSAVIPPVGNSGKITAIDAT